MAEPIGYITETIGSVFAESDGQIRELAAGSPVYEGDVLVTADGQAEVEFRDDSQLSIGENTRMGLDEYVYQEDNSASNMFFSLVQGVFRAITGKIADNNPDGVNMETPLALIGIRGTTLGANYDPDSESGSVYSEEVEPGRSIIVTDSFGRVVVINFSGGAVDLQMGLPMSDVRFATPDELSSLRSLAPFTDAGGDQGRSASGADQEGGEQGDGQQGDEEPAATEEPADGDEIQSDMVVVDMQGEMTAEMESLFKPGQLQVALAVDDITELFPQLAPRVQQTEPENENHTPVANKETVVTEEDQTISGKVSASDPDGDQLSFALLQGPQNGSASMDSDGTYIYTPDTEFSGEDTFTYVVTDSQGGKGTGSVTVTVAATNDPPVAENMQVTTAYEESAAGAIAASDPDGDALVFSLDSAPGNGQVVVAPNGEFTYQPNAGYSGTDSFTVLVTDSEGAETAATVTVTVQEPLNQPPDAQNATVSIDSGENLLGQLVATDPDGDALTFALNAGPAHGSVFINPDGSFSYTPNAGYSGSDTFSYTVDDGKGGTDTATVTISVVDVNEPPVGQNMSFSVDEGGSLSGVLAASDPDGDALTFSLFSGPQNGNVTVNANGTFSYTPAADFVGVDSFVYLVNDGNGGTDTATVQISVAGELNEPAISINNATAEEAGGAMVFTLALTHQWDQTVTVNWSTADGTAVAGEDYIAASGTVSFSPGQTIATITVDIIDDALFEGAETLLVKLNNPQNGSLENTEGVGTILANDEPLPSVSIADAQAFESDGAMFFTVTLSQAADSEVTVLWSTQDGSALAGQDYEASSGQLVFAPGQTVATISVNLLDDAVLEESESFTVKLSAPSGAELGDAQAVGEIIDDDQALPAISIADAQAVEADGTMTFIVTLSQAADSEVTVLWSTQDGSALAGQDYEASSGQLVFAPGQTVATISVNLLDDAVLEESESFTVKLSAPSGAELGDAQAVGEIIDNDQALPAISIADAQAVEADGTMTFIVSLDAPTESPVSVDWTTADLSAAAGADYESASGTLTFEPGQTEAFITVTLLDDFEIEGDHSFEIVLTNPVNGTLADTMAIGTIIDDDDIPVASVSGGEALESEGSVAFSIFLDRPTSQEVVITWRIDDGSAVAGEDFVSTTGTAIFQPGTTELFTSVQLLDDAEVEGTETFSVVLETAEGATLGESVATLTILDDDTTQPTEGDDILYGTSEADFIDGLGGNDEIFGLEGADTLLGSGGNDFIYGDAGNDSLLGGLGDDVIHDDAGDDMVLGGEGEDTFSPGAGNDTIDGAGFGTTEDGMNKLNYAAYGTAGSLGMVLVLADPGSPVAYGSADGSALGLGQDLIANIADVVGSMGDDSITGDSQFNSFYGDEGDDWINGLDGEDLLAGDGGNDTLLGGNQNDALFGYDGDDYIGGEADNDFLFGENGKDQLFGGDGTDYLLGGFGDDTLQGDAGNDSLFGGTGSGVANDGNDYLYGGDGMDFLYGETGNDALSGGLDNDLLSGEAGNDSLFGEGGADSLLGGTGADYLVGGDGADVFIYTNTGQGTDIIADFGSGDYFDMQAANFGFTVGATLGATNFYTWDDYNNATSTDPCFVYYDDGETQELKYDPDGPGGPADYEILAEFENGAEITASDIHLDITTI